MPAMERRIQKISEDVQQRVRGGSIAPDIGAILLQLMYNSVDAGAAMIAIRVDLENMLVQVRLSPVQGRLFELQVVTSKFAR